MKYSIVSRATLRNRRRELVGWSGCSSGGGGGDGLNSRVEGEVWERNAL